MREHRAHIGTERSGDKEKEEEKEEEKRQEQMKEMAVGTDAVNTSSELPTP